MYVFTCGRISLTHYALQFSVSKVSDGGGAIVSGDFNSKGFDSGKHFYSKAIIKVWNFLYPCPWKPLKEGSIVLHSIGSKGDYQN